MPFRLIGFIVTLVLVALFMGINLDNRCDVSVVFHLFENVPVAMSMLFAFCAGAVSVLPFVLFGNKKKKESGDSLPIKKNIGKTEPVVTTDVTKNSSQRDLVKNKMAVSRHSSFSIVLALFFILSPLLFAQEDLSRVNSLVESALSAGSRDEAITALGRYAAAEKSPAGRKKLLVVTASLEERSGLPIPAAKHYSEASWSDPAGQDYSLILAAARCFLSANETAQASSLVQSVLLSCFDEQTLIHARVMAGWINLSSGNHTEALALISSYAANPVFSDWAPALLFTLYWNGADPSARDRILSLYPVSPEAAVLRGEMTLSPVSFWYLMDRQTPMVAKFNAAVATPVSPVASLSLSTSSQTSSKASQSVAESEVSEGALWQQTGFFKNHEYAEELRSKLISKGFQASIRTVTRPSGTVYHAVLVPEDSAFKTAARLKDAGFESSLVVD